MWIYVRFAVFNSPVVQLHSVGDKRIKSNHPNVKHYFLKQIQIKQKNPSTIRVAH